MPGLRGNLFDLYQRANVGMSTPAYGVPAMPGQRGGPSSYQLPDEPPSMQDEQGPQMAPPPAPAPPPIPTEPGGDRFQRSYDEVVQHLQPKERAAYEGYHRAHPDFDPGAGLPAIEAPGKWKRALWNMNAGMNAAEGQPAPAMPLGGQAEHGMEVYKQRVLNAIAMQDAEEKAAEAKLKEREMTLKEGDAPYTRFGQVRGVLESPAFVAPEGGVPIGEGMQYAGLPAPTGAMAQGRISRTIAAGQEQAAKEHAQAEGYKEMTEPVLARDRAQVPIAADRAGREAGARTGAEIRTKAGMTKELGDIATAQQAPALAARKELEDYKAKLKDIDDPADKNAATRILRGLPKGDPQGRADRLNAIREAVNAGSMPKLSSNPDALAALAAELKASEAELARSMANRAPKAE